jgi:hypothetical protein
MKCPRCKRDHPAENFAVDRSKTRGRKSHCKACDNEKSRAYYRDRREKKLEAVKARQQRFERKRRRTRSIPR